MSDHNSTSPEGNLVSVFILCLLKINLTSFTKILPPGGGVGVPCGSMGHPHRSGAQAEGGVGSVPGEEGRVRITSHEGTPPS